MEITTPYRAIDSPRATKISALPKALGSSLVAAIAAGAPAATAIPPPTPERPVTIAAAISPSPLPLSEEEASTVSLCAVSAAAVALSFSAAETEKVKAHTVTAITANAIRFLARTFLPEIPLALRLKEYAKRAVRAAMGRTAIRT